MHVVLAWFWYMCIFMPMFMMGMTYNTYAMGIYTILMLMHLVVPLCFLKKKPEGRFIRMRLLYLLQAISAVVLMGIFTYTLATAPNPPPVPNFVSINATNLCISAGMLFIWLSMLVCSKALTPDKLKGCL